MKRPKPNASIGTNLTCVAWAGLMMRLFLPASYANTALPPMCYVDAKDAYTALVQQQQKSQVIDINTANAVDFVKLIGVGNQTAQAIIEYRQQHGRFGSVDDLQKVRGIGRATIDKNRHRLSVASTGKPTNLP